ncbi:creatininase family protein [Pontibacter anaerobius]|uniref:Creatininase family protein n=1 Tax=Pontibacter anaerobius TaxID=2993940 RepID=A0ABT3RB19_9BACT|nr:creatininase family protein [Pontibacter anaerobius]MCX2739058.1 creatininase family protein [Pontibacter anaerobius]
MRLLVLLLLLSSTAFAQDIPFRWDELTASDWPKALEKSNRTCILPIGILEKHGPHAPMGSDLIHVREWSARAAKNEYAVVFPDYFYGQVFEAQQQPGTFALPSRVVWDLLDATVAEIARNGFDKIVIVNGHGGNPQLLRYFVQSQLEKRRNYAVYFFDPVQDPAFTEKVNKVRKSDPSWDQHGGENETSTLLYLRPDLVKQERATQESGVNQKRLPSLPNLYTGIWWYASYPNHYAGEGAKASKELGKLLTENKVEALTKALKAVKSDTKTLELQKEYFDKADKVGGR